MKHRQTGRTLGRPRRQRKALLKTLLGSLIVREKITTTEAKAKEMKLFIDQLINKAKTAQTDQARKVAMLRALSAALPAMAVAKLTKPEFIQKFESRRSGYVRITKLDQRPGDAARMAVIEFIA